MIENRLQKLFYGLLFSAITLIAALCYATAGHAAGTSATVSWNAPVSYTDGTAVASGDIASYTVKWSGTVSGSTTVAGTALSAVVPVACGTVTFTVLATSGASAKYPNQSSGDSNTAVYATGVTCTLNPPTAVKAS